LFLGTSRTQYGSLLLPYDLTPLGFPGCSLRVSGDVALPFVTGTTGNDMGFAAFDFPFPLVAFGGFLYAQWLVLGTNLEAPGGVSDAVGFRLGR
jgi:hypothetical protein